MKKIHLSLVLLYLILSLFASCKTQHSNFNKSSFSSVKFIDEYIIPDNTMYNNTEIGGLSSIDYINGKYYLISDDKSKPVRFYEMNIDFDKEKINHFEITNMISIKNENRYVDPEGLRFDRSTNHFYWTSEGAIRKGVSPTIYEINENGELIKEFKTPDIFEASIEKGFGPRQNGTFEGLSMSIDKDYFWVGMELPLKQDGEEPSLTKANSPVRISKFNKKTGNIDYQFVYNLDKIPRDSKPSGKFLVNGLPEILEIDKSHFIFVERAYASGHNDGGNTVKLYLVDATTATDIKNFEELRNSKYIPAKRTLLFNFETIRSKLTKGIVDNIEGITFGPNLSNGNKTLVLVSDNNFNKFNPQLNQIIILELAP